MQLIKEKFPFYLDEMKGLAEGSEIDFQWVKIACLLFNSIKNKLIFLFKKIFALNLRVEILHLTGLFKEKHSDEILKECSDFYLSNDKFVLNYF